MYIGIRNWSENVLQKREFYISKRRRGKLADGETEHKSSLLDYNEYLKDPSGYFLRKERWSFDGA